MIFDYDREGHVQYLLDLVKEGTYQDYENAIYDMHELGKSIADEEKMFVRSVIDQADGVYYGDLFFQVPQKMTMLSLYSKAESIVKALNDRGIPCHTSCLYFNQELSGFMYTAVAIKATDGPDLYAQGTRTFTVR